MTTTAMPRRRTGPLAEELEPVTIRFPKSLHQRAIEAARVEDRTFASLVIYALRRYVESVERTQEPPK
jgi:predicted HicB family RNase H-like nuclease